MNAIKLFVRHPAPKNIFLYHEYPVSRFRNFTKMRAQLIVFGRCILRKLITLDSLVDSK